MRTDTTHRFEALDGVRGVAALCVLIDHFGQILDVYWPPNVFLAVDVFFMMSGFVIAHAYGSRLRAGLPAWTYLARRFIRLYPMFIASLLIGAAVLCYGATKGVIEYPARDIVRSVALNALYVPFLNASRVIGDFGQIFPADPPAWSLFLEILGSAGFLLLFGLGRKALLTISGLWYAVLVIAGIFFARVKGDAWIDLNNGYDSTNFLGGLPRVGFAFTLGLVLQGLLRDGFGAGAVATLVRRVPYPSFMLYALLLAMLLFPKSARGIYPMLAVSTLVPAMVFLGAHIRTRAGLETNIARFLGWMSYPLFCLHVPVIRLVIFAQGGVIASPTRTMAISGLVTLACVVVLTKCYEEPLRRVLTARLRGSKKERSSAPNPARGIAPGPHFIEK